MSREYDLQVWQRLRFRDLHTFQAVAEAGSIAKAAHRLGLSQPAVSKTVKELEANLGVPILDRTYRGVEVTPYGRVLIKHARDMFDDFSKGLSELRFLQDPTEGHLRIGAPEPATAMLAGMVCSLQAAFPKVTFEIIVADTLVLFGALRDRAADVVLTRLADPVIEPDLEFDELFNDPLVVIAGSQNPLTKRKRIVLADLINEPWVLPPQDTVIGRFGVEIFRTQGLVAPSPKVVTPSSQMRIELVARTAYLSLAPRATLNGKDHGITRLHLDLPETARPVGLATLANRSRRPVLAAFIENARRSVLT
jgi:DNA-binding transcriptional LysR family regulator